MIGVVWVTEAEQSERAISALIALLVVVAVLLTLLTIWYWRHTSPKRHVIERRSIVDLNNTNHDLSGDPTAIQPTVPSDVGVNTGSRHFT